MLPAAAGNCSTSQGSTGHWVLEEQLCKSLSCGYAFVKTFEHRVHLQKCKKLC